MIAEIVKPIFQETEESTKYVYIKSTTVYVPRRKWHSRNPSLASECAVPLPPEPRGERHTRLRVRGWGSSNSDEGHKLWYSLYIRKATPTLLLLTVSKFSGQCSKYSATVEKKFGP